MGIRNYIRTIEDLERLYYSNAGAQFIQKDAQVTSSTTGVYNAVYGAQVWSQLNHEANAFGVLPKVPWERSGWRVIGTRAVGTPSGGVTEGGALPDTIKPTFEEASAKPKTVAHTFDVSEVQEFLAKESKDDAVGDLAYLRQYMGTEHREHLNAMLMGIITTVAGDNVESLDRIVSAYDEVNSCSDVDAGDSDPYGAASTGAWNDRDEGATWTDAYVNHGSATDRDLTDSILRTTKQNVLNNGGNPTFWMTGHDTMATIEGLYEAQVRYNIIGQTEIQPSVNGIVAPKGVGVGIKVATILGYPMIITKDTPQDTISRIFLLDTSNPEGFDIPRLSVKIAKPTQYFEAGMSSGDPFGIDALADQGMYRTMGELICTFFKAQGKIRDLQ